MLKLKKTNFAQKAPVSMETEEQSNFVEQTIVQQKLTKLLKQQPNSHARILAHLTSSTFSSISSSQFVKILSSTLSPTSLQSSFDVDSCLQILQKLISIPHDQKQVKSLIKKQKSIDALLLLSLLWNVKQNEECWKYVAYMIECYPAEMILRGKQYVTKWEQYFEDCEQKKMLNEEVKRKVKEFQLFERLKKQLQNNHEKGFVDTYINL